MGMYYAVGNITKKEYIRSPFNWETKFPSQLFDNHPVPRMLFYLMFQRWNGDQIAIYPDSDYPWDMNLMKECSCCKQKHPCEWKNITEETVNEINNLYEWYKSTQFTIKQFEYNKWYTY